MVRHQLGEICNQKVLDFGSKNGVTACYFARCNDVTAIKPSVETAEERWQEYRYAQMIGSTDQL